MLIQDDWDDPARFQGHFARQLQLGRLALVLGAGVSLDFGLPDFKGLVARTFESVSMPVPDHALPVCLEYLRAEHFRGNREQFLTCIRDALYRDVDLSFSHLRHNSLVAALAALVMNSRRGVASAVITFNFDDVLERYLRYHGFVVASAFRPTDWVTTADVCVYHPHGFLPSDGSSQSDDIIVDQASYSTVIGKDDNHWRQLVLTILRRRVCLLVGLSGDDANLESLLFGAKTDHPALRQRDLYWGAAFSRTSDPVTSSRWNGRGIYCKKIDAYKEIPDVIFGICQRAAELEDR